MSDHMFNAVKTGGKFALDVVGGYGAAVGFADATAYYYASTSLNAILQTQFQSAGWPTGTNTVANNGDVKGAIMFARDQYYAKAKSALGGAFFDLAKGFAVDGLLSYFTGGLSTIGIKTVAYLYDGYEGIGKVKGAVSDIQSFKNVPDAPNGPPKTAATALIETTWQLKSQGKYLAKSKQAAALEALKQIVGPFEFESYRARSGPYKKQKHAINRVAAWLTIG